MMKNLLDAFDNINNQDCSLQFERFETMGDYQGNPVIHYCDPRVPYTRITEHKHFAPWEQHEKTICFREFSKLAAADDTPYYPLRLQEDQELLRLYMNRIERESGMTFIGRLGTYRYLDMHVVIGESLDLAKVCLEKNLADWPKFSASPL
jgi:UDP-galactopyranose mutase